MGSRQGLVMDITGSVDSGRLPIRNVPALLLVDRRANRYRYASCSCGGELFLLPKTSPQTEVKILEDDY